MNYGVEEEEEMAAGWVDCELELSAEVLRVTAAESSLSVSLQFFAFGLSSADWLSGSMSMIRSLEPSLRAIDVDRHFSGEFTIARLVSMVVVGRFEVGRRGRRPSGWVLGASRVRFR